MSRVPVLDFEIKRAEISNRVNPIVLGAALHNEKHLIDRLSDGHAAVHDEYPGHWLSLDHSIEGKTGYGAPIVGDQDPALVSCPIQNGPIVGLRQSHILDTDQVDVRQSPDQAAHDVVVEVLVTQQPDQPDRPSPAA